MTQHAHQHGHGHEEPDINDLGLQADLAMWVRSPLERRQILKMGAVGIGVLLAGVSAGPLGTVNTIAAAAEACVTEIPQETAGPYPADGSQASSQALNALTLSGIVRSDIRTSLTTKNTAQGIPTTLELTFVQTDGDCQPLANYAIYLWHCDRNGNYSLYSNGVTNEDYLRGVQVTDGEGKVRYTTIFPACYSGRWPHVHFEIYPSLEQATSSANAVHTTQLALPKDVCDVAYATAGYEQSVRNLSQITLETDNIFSDGYSLQIATVTGDPINGYLVQLTVGIASTSTNTQVPGGPGGNGGPGGPGGSPPPSGAPAPSGMPSAVPVASATPAPAASASPSVTPGLPNTGAGGTDDGAKPWLVAAPIVAAAAALAPVLRRRRKQQ